MRRVAVDTNLLLLLVIGATSRDLVTKHKRLRKYGINDFELLTEFLNGAEIVVTPNALTEVSNLAGQGLFDPLRSNVFRVLAHHIEKFHERHHSSGVVVRDPEFVRLGLADCAWLCIHEPETALITDDLDLYLAALDRGIKSRNFSHMRVDAGIL